MDLGTDGGGVAGATAAGLEQVEEGVAVDLSQDNRSQQQYLK